MNKYSFKIMTGLLAGVLATAMCGCSILPAEEDLPDKPVLNDSYIPKYETFAAKRATIDTSSVVRATYHAVNSQALSFEASGMIYEICVNKGDQVQKGQLLASFDCTAMNATADEYERQKEQYQLSLRQLGETHVLECKKIDQLIDQKQRAIDDASPEALNTLQLELEALQVQRSALVEGYENSCGQIEDELSILLLKIEANEKLISNAQITAPYDGLVTKIEKYTAGDYIDRGKTLITLDSNEQGIFVATEAAFEVGQTYTAQTNSGMTFTVEAIAAQEEESMTDQLIAQSPELQIAGSTLVNVTIPGVVRENTLYVRQEAVHEQDGMYYVYVLTDGKAEMREVKVGVYFGVVVEITEGLEEGEEVVI